jgi:CRP-like cAMP-binding protein
MANVAQSSVRNQLLAKLPAEDFAYLVPHLRRVDLSVRTTVHGAGEPIAAVFFPERGYASMLAALDDGDSAEVGMIGSEGMIGLPLLYGTDRSLVEAMVQGGGSAFRLSADMFRRALEERPSLLPLLLRYAMAFNVQVTMTAACNGRHLVERRFARWLLMAHDRTDGNVFAMTHEFLSMMLGVRRAGVTVAAGALQKAGYVHCEKGQIQITDRAGLEAAARECHFIVRVSLSVCWACHSKTGRFIDGRRWHADSTIQDSAIQEGQSFSMPIEGATTS